MTTKPKKQTTPEIKKLTRKAVPVYSKPDDSEEDVAREYSKLAVSPALAAYRVINGAENKSGFGEHHICPADFTAESFGYRQGRPKNAVARRTRVYRVEFFQTY